MTGARGARRREAKKRARSMSQRKDEVEKRVWMLGKAAQAEGMERGAEQRVGSKDAAKLWAQNKEYRAKARQEKRGPRYFNLPVGSAKKS